MTFLCWKKSLSYCLIAFFMDIESKTPEETAKVELSVPSFVIRIYNSPNCADSPKFGVAFNSTDF